MPIDRLERARLTYRRRIATPQWQIIVGEKFLEAWAALRCHTRNYEQQDPLERRQSANRSITALRSFFSIIEGERHLAAIDEVKRALHYVDARIEPPILARSLQDAAAATRLLSGKTQRTRKKYLIGAWVLAAVERLRVEGKTPTQAIAQAARIAGISVNTIEKWRAELARDNAPFWPLPRGDHLQRVSFRVKSCLSYADAQALSGAQMLALIKTDPAVVHRYAARRP